MQSMSLPGYKESVDYLYGLQKYGIKFGLNRIENLMGRIGNPHKKLRCIHIGGTNGKGSTAAILASILWRHGFKVGLYTSPHLVRFTERFRINDREVSPERIVEVFKKLMPFINDREPPTFFEMVTAMGFLYFAEEEVDWAVIEVGMGGRLDATNVVEPEASIITNVSLDHQDFLGCTLASIAREKAGIIKDGVSVITGAQQPLAQGILRAVSYKHQAPLFNLGTDFRVRRNMNGSFQYQGLRSRLPALRLGLKGGHQYRNAALALAAVEVLEKGGGLLMNPVAVQEGLLQVYWPARLEVLEEKPLMVLDGAHNPRGAESLREALKQNFSYKRLHLVIGVMADKDIRGIFQRLLPLAETAIFTQPRYSRAASPEELGRIAGSYIQRQYVIPDPASAIRQARLFAAQDDLICITGSLYFAGEIKELFGERVLV
ncbi:MAG: bifunctional folylpolyglutamate synthase/dihydrofolate synthase [Syntrophobacteraceae bacterium]